MAALNLQPLQFRSHWYQQRCAPHGDSKRNCWKRLETPGVNGCKKICIILQIANVQKPTSGVHQFVALKAGEDADPPQTSSPTKSKNITSREWYKMMDEIKESGNAVTVLAKQKKAKKLTKESVLGTLVKLKQMRMWRSVMEVCEWLKQQDWWQFGFEDYCLLMAAYGREGKPEEAEALLQAFNSAGYAPNIAMHTCLIAAYGKRRMFQKAESEFKKLGESGPSPTLLTYHTLIKAYTEADRLDDADRIFSSMVGKVRPDGRCYNLMIDAYGKAGRAGIAYQLYQKMRDLKLNISVVTFNTLIAHQKSYRDAESIFRQMRAAKVVPDVVSYTAMINAYGKAGKPEDAQQKFDEMVAVGIRPTSTSYNVLLDSYAKAKQVEEAEAVLKKMRKDKCTPTIYSFTTLVQAYASVGNMERAEEILRRMKFEKVLPNLFTFTTMLAGYAAAKDMKKMMKTFNDMKNLGLKPNQAVYTVLVGAWGAQEDFEASKFWFNELVSSGLIADHRARTAMINASKSPEQLQEALALVDKYNNVSKVPDHLKEVVAL